MNFIVGLAVSCSVFRIFRGPGLCRREPFDIWGSVFVLVGYPALLIGFTLAANSGWKWGRFGWWFAVAAVGLLGFVWIERRTASPLVDLRIFRHGRLSAALASNLLISALYNPITFCGPLYLHNVLSASPLAIGIILSLLPVMTALTSPLSGKASDRIAAGRVVTVGLGLISLGVFIYSRLGFQSSYVAVALALGVIGMGIGVLPGESKKLLSRLSRKQAYGVLSALLSSFATAAGTLGTTAAVAAGTENGRFEPNDPTVRFSAAAASRGCSPGVPIIVALRAQLGGKLKTLSAGG
jgi:hypothetical protein